MDDLHSRWAQLTERYYLQVERDHEEKEQQHKGKNAKTGPRSEEADLFLGAFKTYAQAMVCLELAEWIGKDLERESSVLKQSRKAREERAAAKQ